VVCHFSTSRRGGWLGGGLVKPLDTHLSEPVAGNIRLVRLKQTHIACPMEPIQTVSQIGRVQIKADARPQALTEVNYIAGITAGVDGGKKALITDLRKT
jgi:hypothetical protein